MSNLDILQEELEQAADETEAKTQRNFIARIDLRATKQSAQDVGIQIPPRWQFTIPIWKDAGMIKRFQDWISMIDVFFKDRNERAILAQALWEGVKILVESTEKYKEYKALYEAREYDKVPAEIKQLFDDMLQENHTRLFNERRERQDTNWTLYKELGRKQFIELYQHIENFGEILAYCENCESSQSSNESLTKSERILIRFTELAQDNVVMQRKDVMQDLLDRGLIEDMNDKHPDYLASTNGLSKGGKRGHWDFSKMQTA